MKYFYDTVPVYPYICLSETNATEIEKVVEFLKKQNIIVNKFYESPRYPASNGIIYDFLLRINFQNSDKRIKPDKSLIEELLNLFNTQKNKKVKDVEDQNKYENEEKYLKQIRTFLSSERKIIEVDKQFIKEQLEYLNELSKNFKQENNRLAKIISNHNSNLNNEILEILDRKNNSNAEAQKLDEFLKEKERLLLVKEKELEKKYGEVEQERDKLIEYKNELDKNNQELVEQIRNLQFGINDSEEDTIQDLRILVFGESKLKYLEIREIFSEAFNAKFGEELNKKAVEARFLSYEEVKNSNVVKRIESGKYDYILAGPHDHSVKGKNIKIDFKNFCKQRNINSHVTESKSDPLNFEGLRQYANWLMDDWDKQFETVE